MTSNPSFIQTRITDDRDVRTELSTGLLEPAARISPKYLYDALGSKLFEAITCLPEYYPTRTEAAIMQAHLGDMARHIPAAATLIDLGAGNCEKAARLFGALQPAHYVAVDISVDFLKGSLGCLQRQFPHLRMSGVGMDFSEKMDLPEELQMNRQAPCLVFYPGSSIGNFTPEQALRFLQRIRAICSNHPDSQLLIGVDLVKDVAALEAAYDDSLGVTAAFNRNMLLHLNTRLGSDFNITDWKHVAFYNTQADRIEMHLEALNTVTVSWQSDEGKRVRRRFLHGESIHTENSYKWTVERFTTLLRAAGFAGAHHYTDADGRFAVFLASI